MRLHKLLADKRPCPLCNAPSLVVPSLTAGIAVPKRYQADPEMHVGWHFREGQSVTVQWWGVAALVGLIMVVEDGLHADVPQIDEAETLADRGEVRAIMWAERLVRREWEAIAKAGHRAYHKSARETPLETVREIWMTTPEFHRLARDLARGCRTWDEFNQTMREVLAASRAAAENAAGTPDGVG